VPAATARFRIAHQATLAGRHLQRGVLRQRRETRSIRDEKMNPRQRTTFNRGERGGRREFLALGVRR
jgi:hypothetical protein